MSFEEARARLNQWTRLLDNGKEASTNKSAKRSRNAEALSEAWWRENSGTTPDWRNARTVAYLCAYLDLARGPIPMAGIPVDAEFIWPDRAVMRALLAAECIICRGDHFHLTDRGEALVAPFLLLAGDRIIVAIDPSERAR